MMMPLAASNDASMRHWPWTTTSPYPKVVNVTIEKYIASSSPVIAPVVIGLILGPIAESQLRRALAISLGDPMVLLQSPMSATLLGIAVIALLAPFVLKGLGRFKANED